MTAEPESVPDRAALIAAAALGLIFILTGALLLAAASAASHVIPVPEWMPIVIGAVLLAVGIPGLLYGAIGLLRRPRRRPVDPLVYRIR